MANYHKLFGKVLAPALREGMQARANSNDSADHKAEQRKKQTSPSSRRRLAGAVAMLLLLAAAAGHFSEALPVWIGSASAANFLVSALTRIGLVFGAIWLAWDSLQRPARWLPPGLALLGTLAIILVAAQPKLIIAVLPLFGVATVLTSMLRAYRKK